MSAIISPMLPVTVRLAGFLKAIRQAPAAEGSVPNAKDGGTALAEDLLEFLVQTSKIKDPRALKRIADEIARAKATKRPPPRPT